MASLPVIYFDLEGHFCCVNPVDLIWDMKSGTAEATVVKQHVLSTICLDITGKRTWLVISTIFPKMKGFSR